MKNGIKNLDTHASTITMKIEQIDNRGHVMVFIIGGKEYLLVYTMEGYKRGGHIHSSKQYNVLLDGGIYWITKKDKVIIYSYYFLPSIIESKSKEYHELLSITDSLILEWKE